MFRSKVFIPKMFRSKGTNPKYVRSKGPNSFMSGVFIS